MPIHNEQSDIRIHVCFVAKCVYVFPTESVKKLANNDKYYTASVGFWESSKGKLIPPEDIDNCIEYQLPDELWVKHKVNNLNTSHRAIQAQNIVIEAIENGYIPLSGEIEVITDKDRQIAGGDLKIGDDIVQIKCDYKGGRKALGGTGNLYIELIEKNWKGEY